MPAATLLAIGMIIFFRGLWFDAMSWPWEAATFSKRGTRRAYRPDRRVDTGLLLFALAFAASVALALAFPWIGWDWIMGGLGLAACGIAIYLAPAVQEEWERNRPER